MKTKSILTTLLLLSLLTAKIFSQQADISKILFEAKQTSDKALLSYDAALFMESNAACERVLSVQPDNQFATYLLAYNYYRMQTVSMKDNDRSKVELYFNKAKECCDKLTNSEEYDSEAKTLLAAVYMMKLAINQSDAPAISMTISSLLEQASFREFANPRTLLIRGIMALNTPPVFGGSVDAAMEYFNKAEVIFQNSKSPDELKPNWGYLETLAYKGQALTKKGMVQEAKSAYNKVLEIEPNFGWVKYVLLPQLEKQVAEKESTTTK
ncbi:MAG: tetratricopeptide repeat protein [bacterium]